MDLWNKTVDARKLTYEMTDKIAENRSFHLDYFN